SRRSRPTREDMSSNPSSPRRTRPASSARMRPGCLDCGNRWECRMDPSQAVRDEIADLSRGDLEAVLSYYTDDVYFEDTSVPTPCRTKAEMRDFMQVFYDAFPDLRIEIRNVFEGSHYVTAEYDLLGTMRGEFLGHSPTGKAFRIKAVSIYEHNGTLFTKETVYYDSASLLSQIGVSAPAPPPKGEGGLLKARWGDRRDDLRLLVSNHPGLVRQPGVVVDRVALVQLVVDAADGDHDVPLEDERAFLSFVRSRGRVGAGAQPHDDHLHPMLDVGRDELVRIGRVRVANHLPLTLADHDAVRLAAGKEEENRDFHGGRDRAQHHDRGIGDSSLDAAEKASGDPD